MEFEFIVTQEDDKTRLDKFLTKEFAKIKPEVNRSKIQHLIDDKMVTDEQNNPLKSASAKTKTDQKITVKIPPAPTSHLQAKEIDFEIVYEDDDLLVINKPAALTVHPGAGNQDHTLVNGLLFTHKDQLSTSTDDNFRPGIVHRLDKDTSGLMLVAKNDFAHQSLSAALQERTIKRNYIAFIYGVLKPNNGTIDKNIDRNRHNRLKMAISNRGRHAITHYKTAQTFCDGFISAVNCKLETGRTHQIRVHLESEKHSLVGDSTYSNCRKTAPQDLDDNVKDLVKNFPRQALHSYKISFLHPRSNEEKTFEIDLPQDMKNLKEALENEK